jgi:hypothetical protein
VTTFPNNNTFVLSLQFASKLCVSSKLLAVWQEQIFYTSSTRHQHVTNTSQSTISTWNTSNTSVNEKFRDVFQMARALTPSQKIWYASLFHFFLQFKMYSFISYVLFGNDRMKSRTQMKTLLTMTMTMRMRMRTKLRL